jgi:hypothetical protein
VSARVLLLAAALSAGGAAALASAAEEAAPRPAGTVTFAAGEANRVAARRAFRLATGDAIYQGDVVETARRTRIELTLADGSVLRLGPLSRVELDTAAFGTGADDRKVSARLRVGNVWAKVTRAVGGEARFEVKTDNAVAGVRGTTFRVDASADRSVVVKVYAGAVAVAAGKLPRPAHGGPGARPERRQVAGPQQVTRQEWERLVGAMMQVRVAADGTPAEPERFGLARDDEWERWNRDRDAAR